MIGKTLAHYEVLAAIGKGGMGEVYRARDTKLGREVALKILPREMSGNPERDARFDREARTLASLQHPNIASIYGFEEDDGVRFLAMELVEGPDLSQRLAQGALSAQETLRIAQQIALGLEAAHQKTIIHRDLKPANIKVGSDGVVKILDFGLARAFGEEEMSETELANSPTITSAMTQAGTILGTAAYMSPEQARGQTLDRRADIWAFGVIVFEMLTGRQLFAGDTISDTLAAVLRSEPDWSALPPTTPPGLRRLLLRCLQRDVRERMRDAGDIHLELQEIQDGKTPNAGPEPASASRVGRLVPWVLVALLIAALAWRSATQSPPNQAIIEFAIHPPTDHEMREFSVAPDGNSLVVVCTNRLGRRSLWLRRFDDAQLRELPGTGDATFPFWSPDSRFVGFFAERKLRSIELTTGGVQDIADAPNGRGGDWSGDNRILFTPDGAGVLYTVSPLGGPLQPMTTLRGPESTHRFPHFTADGHHFTYSAHSNSSDETFRAFQDLGEAERSDLPEGMSESIPVGKHLLFVRQGNLVAQRFDAKTGSVSGDPLFLADKIDDTFPRTGRSSFSCSPNGVLALLQRREAPSHFAWFDRRGLLLESTTPGEFERACVSPDLQKVLFSTDSDIWLHDLARGSSRKVAENLPDFGTPLWSGDGRSFTYATGTEILRIGLADQTTDKLLTSSQTENPESMNSIIPMDETSDGSNLVIGSWDPSSDFDLWVLPAGGQPERVIDAPGRQGDARISPNDRWLAYSSDQAGRSEVYLCRLQPKAVGFVLSIDGGRNPVWSDDGQTIYYIAPDDMLMSVSAREDGEQMDLGLPQPMFRAPPGTSSGDADDYFATPHLMRATGDRFLFHRSVDAVEARVIRVVMNWEERLKQ